MQHKKHLISTLLFSCYMLISINAQNLQITFTGSGLSTTIDSVQVLNIAQGTSVTVKSTDGLQLVGTTSDIETHLHGKGNLRIFPNPMTETSGIEFFNVRESPVNLEVFDVTGKIVILDKQHLIQGNHKFEISGLNPGIYMVNVLTFNGRYAGKLLSNVENSGTPTIRYQGNNNLSAQKSVLKSTQNLAQMQYNEGERLLLKGISGNYSRVLTLIPTQSQTVNFEFIACTDAGGMHYQVVTIGTQTWMAENLKTTHYSNGTAIPLVNTTSTWDALTATSKAYCWYNDDIANKATYGALYTWAAAMNGAVSSTANPSGIQGVCPTGWHLPSDAEWTQLQNYLIANGYNYDGTTTGNIFAKSLASTSSWSSSSSIGTVGNTDYPAYRNKSGFSALPGGYRGNFGTFYNIGNYGLWWSATEYDTDYAWSRHMNYSYSNVNRGEGNKEVGFSVRCVRDFVRTDDD